MLLRLLREGVIFAFLALWANKLRTFLSLLGITIGIFAVISVFAFVDSWEAQIKNSLANLGNEVIYIEKFPWTFGSDYPWWKYVVRPVPTYKEYEQLQQRSETAAAVTIMTTFNGELAKYEKNSISGPNVMAVSHDYDEVRDFEIDKGRYFSPAESYLGARVIIIGKTIADQLFLGLDPVGREMVVFDQKVKVLGTFKAEGNNSINTSLDDALMVPINLVRKTRGADFSNMYPLILVKGKEGITVSELKDDLRGTLRAIRKLKPTQEENFALNQISLLANQLSALFGAIGLIGWIIGGFSILVGGFGIANIMFVSVYERTSQIGIQKALGAKNYFILFQFLIESVVLSMLGGLLGLFMVYLMTVIAANALDFPVFLSASNFWLGIFVSAIIGVLAGILPAIRASRMNPVDAIRSA
jgi:putative ABC transport system permease protein